MVPPTPPPPNLKVVPRSLKSQYFSLHRLNSFPSTETFNLLLALHRFQDCSSELAKLWTFCETLCPLLLTFSTVASRIKLKHISRFSYANKKNTLVSIRFFQILIVGRAFFIFIFLIFLFVQNKGEGLG